jgi:hypothetical protein
MIEKPSSGRAKFLKNGNSVEVIIPTKTNWFIVIFYTFWLGGWVMGEVLVFEQLRSNDLPAEARPFLLFWIAGWTIGGLYAITLLLWTLAGQETVKVENGILEIGKQIFKLKRTKKYDTREVRHFAINVDSSTDMWSMTNLSGFFSRKNGVLKFDYGSKTFKFGTGIEEAEGRILLEAFKLNPNFAASNFG